MTTSTTAEVAHGGKEPTLVVINGFRGRLISADGVLRRPGRFREGVYVNFLGGDEDPERVREAHGDSVYHRLVDVKTTYDPDNGFHHNQNLRPGSSDRVRGSDGAGDL
jgi:hypothetical protein